MYEPMIANYKQSLPIIYGDTPSFLGLPLITHEAELSRYDVVFVGVPWEGNITWGSYSGCEMAPKVIRHVSARYGTFLPEYQINARDHVQIGDFGDVLINQQNCQETMQNIQAKAATVAKTKAIPIFIGGDHSYTYHVAESLAKEKRLGIIHFDSHFDNLPLQKETYFRANTFHHIYQSKTINIKNLVHFGIRGPRNTPGQMKYALESGASIITMREIQSEGIEKSLQKAITIATKDTDAIYISVCSDILDHSFNPGGPIDFCGLTPTQLLQSLRLLWESQNIAGMDYVEVYPLSDTNNASCHLVVWAVVYSLVGLAQKKINNHGKK